MSGEGLEEVYWKLSKALRGPYSVAPILMTGGIVLSVATSLGPRSLLAELVLMTALFIAILGGLMQLYYMILLSWASNITRGGGPSFKDVLYALTSIGLYYTLIGIVMLSLKVNGYSKTLSCNCNTNTLYSLITLGVHLAGSQACLSICASSRVEEIASKQAIHQAPIEEIHV